MAAYRGEEVSGQHNSGYPITDFQGGSRDGRGLGYTNFQGGTSFPESTYTGVRRDISKVLPESREYHMIPSRRHTNSVGANEEFIGPEPMFRNQKEFDDYIKATQEKSRTRYSETFHSEEGDGETAGHKYSAVLKTLKPQRYEMPNHISYHGELDSKEAERRLSMAQVQASGQANSCNCYLTRYSKNRESYVVSALVYHNGNLTPVHIQLNIDNDNGHSLVGTMKIYRTLDELLHYYESNPLSHDIRGLGTPVTPPDQYSGTSSTPSIYSKKAEEMNSFYMLQTMQKNFIEELGKQREDHRQQLDEERRVFKEAIEQERQAHKDYLDEKRREDEARVEREADLARTLRQEPLPPPVPEKKKTDCILL